MGYFYYSMEQKKYSKPCIGFEEALSFAPEIFKEKPMQGFTFMEVLLSLGLITSISLGILSQQSHLAFLLKQRIISFQKLSQLENKIEGGGV